MPNSVLAALNVAIVLFGVFFFVSTVSSHLMEAITGFINSRGRQLRERLDQILTKEIADEIYDHPIIKSFAGGNTKRKFLANSWPAYIEPSFFAEAIETLFRTMPGLTADSPVFKQLAIDADRAGLEFSSKVEDWFIALNHRLTGTYVRWTTLRLMLFGLAAAVVCDIDIVHLALYLWKNGDVAQNIADKLGAIQTAGNSVLSDADKAKLSSAIGSLVTKGGAGDLPFFAWQNYPTFDSTGFTDWVTKLIGWLVTAMATSLGAQFWFNLMSEALKLRGAGKKPDESTSDADAATARDDTDDQTEDRTTESLTTRLSLASLTVAAPQADELGSLSSKYEVGGRGPGTVSSGINDPGGISYGSYQLSSKTGTAAVFVKQSNYDDLKALTPGTQAFSDKWRELAKADPVGFQQAQHDFIKKNHYDELASKTLSDENVDVSQYSDAVRNVIWSTAVQHGGSSSIVNRAINGLKKDNPNWATANDRDSKLISAIYAERGRRDAKGNLVYFGSSPKSTQVSVAQRFVNEKRDALNMLKNEAPPIRGVEV